MEISDHEKKKKIRTKMQNTAQKGRKKYKRNGKHSKQNYKNHMARKI